MTRLLCAGCCLIVVVCPTVVRAQASTNAGGPSRYAQAPTPAAPQAAAGGQQTGGQAATSQAADSVRQASDVRPITPPGFSGPGPIPQQPLLPAMPQQPEWAVRITPEEEKWIDSVLTYWEARSDKIKLFECRFQRWDYDGGFVDADQKRQPRMYAEGVIKYSQPDKGLYHVEKLVSVLPGQPGQKPQFIAQNPELGEHWVCDGQRVYSFEANKKQVTETPLPPDMRGKAIADGPLPFMFGAKAETIKARYWIHGLVARPDDKSKENKYWLEAVPRSRQDAQNFKMVRIVLDKEDYLPESLEIFAPNYDPPRNDARQNYVFSDRAAKDQATLADLLKKGLDPLRLVNREFYEPRIPLGWKKVVQGDGNVPAAPASQQAGPAPPPRLPTTLPR
jgi:TIGR03009 family protein